MRLGDLRPDELGRRLRGDGLGLRTGPFRLRVRADLVPVRDGLHLLYADHPLVPDDEFCDGELVIERCRRAVRGFRPEVRARFDHLPIFEPVPAAHALPLLEWMLNWWLTAHAHQVLVLHAAAVERDGGALLLPAASGSGKSTLCAALVHRGWRLLTDELTLLDFETGEVHPLVRPIGLKNRSIPLLRAFAPSAVFSAAAHGTPKGTLAHLKAPAPHVSRMDETARPRWIVLPQWQPGADASLTPLDKPQALLEASRQAVNLDLAGPRGFHRLADAVGDSACFALRYDGLDDAIALLDGLPAETAAR